MPHWKVTYSLTTGYQRDLACYSTKSADSCQCYWKQSPAQNQWSQRRNQWYFFALASDQMNFPQKVWKYKILFQHKQCAAKNTPGKDLKSSNSRGGYIITQKGSSKTVKPCMRWEGYSCSNTNNCNSSISRSNCSASGCEIAKLCTVTRY